MQVSGPLPALDLHRNQLTAFDEIRDGRARLVRAKSEVVAQALLAADAVAYNTAPSGQQLQKIFDQMGISDQIKDKATRPPNGAQTMEHMIQGTGNEIGFGLSYEMTPYLTKGLEFVAMLPDDIRT